MPMAPGVVLAITALAGSPVEGDPGDARAVFTLAVEAPAPSATSAVLGTDLTGRVLFEGSPPPGTSLPAPLAVVPASLGGFDHLVFDLDGGSVAARGARLIHSRRRGRPISTTVGKDPVTITALGLGPLGAPLLARPQGRAAGVFLLDDRHVPHVVATGIEGKVTALLVRHGKETSCLLAVTRSVGGSARARVLAFSLGEKAGRVRVLAELGAGRTGTVMALDEAGQLYVPVSSPARAVAVVTAAGKVARLLTTSDAVGEPLACVFGSGAHDRTLFVRTSLGVATTKVEHRGAPWRRDALLRRFRAEFIPIRPGEGRFPKTFRMGRDGGPGSERPSRVVELSRPFAIAAYEVPQNLWEAVTGKDPSRWKGPRNSVEAVSFAESRAFCRRATTMLRELGLIGEEQRVRLPTEAEWEYCARAGTTTLYSFGDDVKDLDAHAWSTRNAAGNDPPVGVKKPNPWGLYDVHGYLWEWCEDAWHADHEGASAKGVARNPANAPWRVVRGGSWKDPAEDLTSTRRKGLPIETRDDAVGLRCVLVSE